MTPTTERYVVLSVGVIVSIVFCGVAPAGVMFFSDRSEFESQLKPGFTTEDFESNSGTNSSSILRTSDPLSSATIDAVWPTGISPGLSVISLGSRFINMFPEGRRFGPFLNPSDAVGASGTASDTLLLFNPRVDAVGFEYYSPLPIINNTDTITMEVFAQPGSPLGSLDVMIDSTVRFFGVISTDSPIDAVRLNEGPFRVAELVDNVTYGAAVPEPGSMAISGVFAVAGSLVRPRRREKPRRSSRDRC